MCDPKMIIMKIVLCRLLGLELTEEAILYSDR